MLKRLVPHFYPKMHLDDYWRPFFRNPSRLSYVVAASLSLSSKSVSLYVDLGILAPHYVRAVQSYSRWQAVDLTRS